MKEKIARWISIITVVPLVSLYVLTIIYISNPVVFGESFLWYFICLLFLTFVPISAYKLKNVLSEYKESGRDGERRLAFIMGVSSYILGTIVSFLFNSPKGVKVIFLAYLFSGSVLSFVNKVIGYKASGHACGVSGPLTILLYFLGICFWYTYFILPIIFWSRLKLNRHNLAQLFSGAGIGIGATLIAIIVYTRLF